MFGITVKIGAAYDTISHDGAVFDRAQARADKHYDKLDTVREHIVDLYRKAPALGMSAYVSKADRDNDKR